VFLGAACYDNETTGWEVISGKGNS
jgi:hypothetical protein